MNVCFKATDWSVANGSMLSLVNTDKLLIPTQRRIKLSKVIYHSERQKKNKLATFGNIY